MNEDDFKIRWDIGKKEQRDEDRDLLRVKKAVGEEYTKWHKKFTTMTGLTLQDLPRLFNDLKSVIMQRLKKEKVSDFGEMTERILNEVYERLENFIVASDPGQPNWLLPDVPHAAPIPFHSEEEFMQIELLQDHFASEDFIGVFLKVLSRWDITVFVGFKSDKDDLKTVSIGRVITLKGLWKLPTLRDYVALLAKTRAEAAAAQSPQSPGPSTETEPPHFNPPSGDTGLGPA